MYEEDQGEYQHKILLIILTLVKIWERTGESPLPMFSWYFGGVSFAAYSGRQRETAGDSGRQRETAGDRGRHLALARRLRELLPITFTFMITGMCFMSNIACSP